MILTESLLLGMILIVSVISFVTDVTKGIVLNKLLLRAVYFGLVINGIYYGYYCSDVFVEYLINLIFITFLSVLMFAGKVWGGGDTKLSILLAFLFPARLYFYYRDELFPILNAFIFAFSIGLIYLVLESAWMLIAGRESKKNKEIKDVLSRMTFQSVAFFFMFMLVDLAVNELIPDFYEDNIALFEILFMAFFVAISRMTLFTRKWVCITASAVSLLVFKLISGRLPQFRITDLLIIGSIHLIRTILSWHNYSTVKIIDLKPGMILSTASSVMMFGDGNVGVNKLSEENMGDRLTEENISSIYRWMDKHPDYETVTIVRKIPFSAFISLGYVTFLILGVLNYYEII